VRSKRNPIACVGNLHDFEELRRAIRANASGAPREIKRDNRGDDQVNAFDKAVEDEVIHNDFL